MNSGMKQRKTYDFIDGLRALAALAVAFYHAFLFTGLRGETVEAYPLLGRFVLNGALAVPVFIVLSGFVLMLPVAGQPGLGVRGGIGRFFARRARRILPPYVAALAFFLAVILLVPYVRDPQGTQWAGKVPVTWDGVVAHLLMIHNLRGSWHDQIDGPMWSVATEMQIYLLMPFVLLPLWRRLGGPAVVVLALLAGLLLHAVAPGFDGAHFWYVGLFAAGMLAALGVERGWSVPALGLVTNVALAVVAVALVVGQYRLRSMPWVTESLLGLVFAAWLFWLASDVRGASATRVRTALEGRWLVRVGLFSYSLYLFHSPLIGLTNLVLVPVDMALGLRLAVMWLVVTPLAVLGSYVAFLLVERRFLTGHQRQAAPADLPAAAVDGSVTASRPVG